MTDIGLNVELVGELLASDELLASVEAIKLLFVEVVTYIFSSVVVASLVASLLVIYVRLNVVVLSSTILAVILIFLVELVMVVLSIFRLVVDV